MININAIKIKQHLKNICLFNINIIYLIPESKVKIITNNNKTLFSGDPETFSVKQNYLDFKRCIVQP